MTMDSEYAIPPMHFCRHADHRHSRTYTTSPTGTKPDLRHADPVSHPTNSGSKRDFNHSDSDTDNDHDTAAEKPRAAAAAAAAISISPELFEKMCLQPQRSTSRMVFGNPTPIGLLGIILTVTPLSCNLMGWRGASDTGAAFIGAYFSFGGLLQLLSGLLEFIIGNTFSSVVFLAYGAFWLASAITLLPGTYPGSLESPSFNTSFGFFLVFMGLLSLVFLICALRTNVIFVIVFSSLVVAFGLLAAQHFFLAQANAELAGGMQIAAGVALFVNAMAVWWIFAAQMLDAIAFPFRIPVGDLTHLIAAREGSAV